MKDSIKEFKYQILNLIHSPTSAMYLFGSGSLNSALNNDNIFGEAVFNMSINSGSKFPSQYTPLNHFSVVLQTSEEKVYTSYNNWAIKSRMIIVKIFKDKEKMMVLTTMPEHLLKGNL